MNIDEKNLRLRIASALLIAPVVLFCVWLGGPSYAVVTGVFAIVGLAEWLRLVDKNISGDCVFFAYGALLLILVMSIWQSAAFGLALGAPLIVALYFLEAQRHPSLAGWLTLGVPYLGSFALAMIYLRDQGGYGIVYYLLAVVWATDIGAFAVGRLIGGAKLAPKISPSKTWAGLGGGMALAAVLGYVSSLIFGARHPLTGFVLALVLAVIAQGGDLFESWVKRRAGAKESGNLIPGHGGVLDRIDGLIFASVVFALFQCSVGSSSDWW